MGLLSWMVLSLTVLPLAANKFPPVNEAQLQDIVLRILNGYRPTYEVEGQSKSPMFSLVVRIPFNGKTTKYDISQVSDAASTVKKTILDCEVYTGTNIVAATVLRWPDVVSQCPNGRVQWRTRSQARTWLEAYRQNPELFTDGTADHAEYRILQKLQSWPNIHNMGQDLLLFYVYASPCTTRCTNSDNRYNILSLLTSYVKFNMVFVFSKVHQPRNANIPEENLREGLMSLGGKIGLQRIFRCDKVNGRMKCANCNDNGNVAGWCYDDNKPPA
ncbi:uncharacterized protein LOC122830001 [Gambusia affinis]|uniref:uncharacterized protein LOC122830001 n=1 Tax=Gambusia affinis TaxID=33528 RepID=UPI001CDCBD84|nr:uncharacterized protein LOC122830001 [Gambusia affinis]